MLPPSWIPFDPWFGLLTRVFGQYHNENVLKKYSPKLKIGEVKEAAKL